MKKILAIAVATAISAPAMADLTIGASTEYNLSKEDATTKSSIETNLDFKGTTTADNGMFVTAFAQLELNNVGSSNLDVDDNYLQIGNEAANVVVGNKAASVAFNAGDDSFAAASAGNVAGGYTAKTLDSTTAQDVLLNITAIEGVTLQVSGNTDTANNSTMGAYASVAAGGVTLAANMVSSDTAAEDGYGLSASTMVGGAAVAVSYADNDAGSSSMAINVGMGAIDVTYVSMDDTATDETSYYGRYNVGDMGLSGLNIDVGAGSGSDADTKMGVEVTYTF